MTTWLIVLASVEAGVIAAQWGYAAWLRAQLLLLADDLLDTRLTLIRTRQARSYPIRADAELTSRN